MLIPLTKDRPFLAQWLILTSALLLLGGFVVQNIYSEHARIETKEREQLSAQAKVVEQNVVRQLNSINLALEGLLHDSLGWSKKKRDDEHVALHLKALTDAIPGVRTILLTDARGTVTASNREQLIGQNFQHRDYFQAPLRNPNLDTLYISPPFTTSLGVYSMSVSRAIIGADGRLAGVISATLAPAEFEVLMNSVRYAPDMWASLVHGSGAVFMMVPERQEVQGKNLAQPGTFFTRHLESGQAANVYTGTVYTTGENRMIALRTIQPKNLRTDNLLVVAVTRDLPTVFAAWRNHAY